MIPIFVAPQVSFWRSASQRAAAADAVDALAADQEAIEEKKDEAEDIAKKIEKEEKAKKLLEQNLGQIQGAVASTVKEINKTKSTIIETEKTISRKEAEINNMNNKIELQKEMLKSLLQETYYNQSQPILNVVLTSANFANVFSDTDHLLTVEDKIREVSAEITESKSQIEQDKSELAEVKEEHEEILDDNVDKKQELVAVQADVIEDIESKEATISKLQKQLAELQGDLNALSGKSYNAKDIRDAVEFASGRTGVPEGVLYGFLKMETNLGANTGKCTYKEVERVAVANYKSLLKKSSKWQASIDLLYKRQGLFYDLVDDLGYSKDKKVSCTPNPKNYIGQGGGMGIPQFMSDVWKGYSPRITSNTGHKTPDPWDLTDGVMAMALKLKGAGATSDSASSIKKASINYLGTFNNNYYSGIVYWSKNYKLLFK
ncbi:MAG: hypothetical protein US63_C0036G0002 [Candidatus Moranbacteria bacterium GW2011_GWC2_37_8]|nr:MAG: hypothetical protein US63_C0036G0002 [Candidatus Moranbacteria bacterium GW2011_GWC2_37_8]KKQ60628.1 MAG: coiled-coil [Parcubacteria group bacterium GW2011_GWC1_38_22]KKQ80620.1 MAG: hypothetical protein UT03_C0021G0003 [Candidatus Moranbacteria bacterium GW2011_GWD2_38_7]